MLIGFYTVADQSDGVLKVMQPYQYYAASTISDRVAKAKWEGKEQLSGYIWHTTGSGKTTTSFKSAQLIATSKEAFPRAMFFGFTGTPILDENEKKDSTTATVFGNELHRYSIADGIRDKNVPGFAPIKFWSTRTRISVPP